MIGKAKRDGAYSIVSEATGRCALIDGAVLSLTKQSPKGRSSHSAWPPVVVCDEDSRLATALAWVFRGRLDHDLLADAPRAAI